VDHSFSPSRRAIGARQLPPPDPSNEKNSPFSFGDVCNRGSLFSEREARAAPLSPSQSREERCVSSFPPRSRSDCLCLPPSFFSPLTSARAGMRGDVLLLSPSFPFLVAFDANISLFLSSFFFSLPPLAFAFRDCSRKKMSALLLLLLLSRCALSMRRPASLPFPPQLDARIAMESGFFFFLFLFATGAAGLPSLPVA